MKVILLKSVPKVGRKDEIVEVADGFAAHSLLPKKLAITATNAAIDALKRRLQNDVATRNIQHSLLDTAIQELNNQALIMHIKANEQGNLFSKVHPQDVVHFLSTEHRINIDVAHLVIPEMKKVGKYEIGVQDGDYRSSFTIELK